MDIDTATRELQKRLMDYERFERRCVFVYVWQIDGNTVSIEWRGDSYADAETHGALMAVESLAANLGLTHTDTTVEDGWIYQDYELTDMEV